MNEAIAKKLYEQREIIYAKGSTLALLKESEDIRIYYDPRPHYKNKLFFLMDLSDDVTMDARVNFELSVKEMLDGQIDMSVITPTEVRRGLSRHPNFLTLAEQRIKSALPLSMIQPEQSLLEQLKINEANIMVHQGSLSCSQGASNFFASRKTETATRRDISQTSFEYNQPRTESNNIDRIECYLKGNSEIWELIMNEPQLLLEIQARLQQSLHSSIG